VIAISSNIKAHRHC